LFRCLSLNDRRQIRDLSLEILDLSLILLPFIHLAILSHHVVELRLQLKLSLHVQLALENLLLQLGLVHQLILKQLDPIFIFIY